MTQDQIKIKGGNPIQGATQGPMEIENCVFPSVGGGIQVHQDQIAESSGWGALAKRYLANFEGQTFSTVDPNEVHDQLLRYFRGIAAEAAEMQSSRIKELEEALRKIERMPRLPLTDMADDDGQQLTDVRNALNVASHIAREILNKGKPDVT